MKELQNSTSSPNQASLQPQQNIPQTLKGEEEEQLRKNITDLIMCKVLLDDMMRTMHINYRNEAKGKGKEPQTKPQFIVQELKPPKEVKAVIERLFVIKVLLFYCQLPGTSAKMRKYISELKGLPTMLLRPVPGTATWLWGILKNKEATDLAPGNAIRKFSAVLANCTQLHNAATRPTLDPVVAQSYSGIADYWKLFGHPDNFHGISLQRLTVAKQLIRYRAAYHGSDWVDFALSQWGLCEGDFEPVLDSKVRAELKGNFPEADPRAVARTYFEVDKLKKGCFKVLKNKAVVDMTPESRQQIQSAFLLLANSNKARCLTNIGTRQLMRRDASDEVQADIDKTQQIGAQYAMTNCGGLWSGAVSSNSRKEPEKPPTTPDRQ